MSSPQNYLGSHLGGRVVSPPLSDRSSHDGARLIDQEDAQLQQDIDAARQMSKVRGNRDTSPSRRPRRISNAPVFDDTNNDPYPHTSSHSPSLALRSSAATTRFYLNNRHGSNTSLDSQHHFIDHRDQTHSASPAVSRTKSALSRTPMKSPNYFANHLSVTSQGLDENAVDDQLTSDEPSGKRAANRRNSSHHSTPLAPQNRSALAATLYDAQSSQIHDDVCFPMPEPMHLAENDRPRSTSEHVDVDDHHHYHHDEASFPPGYPFNFDLQAIEDFASEERERLGLAASWTSAPISADGLRMRNNTYDQKGLMAAYPTSPDSDDAAFYSRRPRNLSSSIGGLANNKYQRKLALFEGAGTAPPPVPSSVHSDMNKTERTKSLDAKTPLLDRDSLPTYHGTDYSERTPNVRENSASILSVAGLGRRRTYPALPPQEKPYRFTFYSNALPSTIHARTLSELPAEGQTFEQLFNGQSSNLDSSPHEGSVGGSSQAPTVSNANMAKSSSLSQALSGRLQGTAAPSTGTNTPIQTSESQAKPGTANAAARNQQLNTPGKSLPGGGIRMDQDPELNTWWLDVLSPTDQEMKLLSRVFGIHPLTTEDILMEETREKIELFRNYYLVCFRSFDQDPYSPTYLEPLNMYIVVFREGILSFHFRGTPHPQNVRRRIKQLKDYINVTSDWISYALIDDITDAFGPLIQSIEYEVDSIDELVLILKEAEQSDMLRRIGTCRKKVMGLLRLMGNKADVVKGLAKRCNENWSVAPKSDIGLYLSDIQDHLITMTQNLNHYEKILSRSHSNYLAQISIEMTDANNQINDVLSKLTALGTVIVPMNVITGLWGMNVNVPGQGVNNLHWFAGICAVMVVVAASGYIAATRYLERTR